MDKLFEGETIANTEVPLSEYQPPWRGLKVKERPKVNIVHKNTQTGQINARVTLKLNKGVKVVERHGENSQPTKKKKLDAQMEYDEQGKLKKVTYSDGSFKSLIYEAGRLMKVEYVSKEGKKVRALSYTEAGKLSAITNE